MAGDAAAAMEVLVQNLINVLKQEISLIRGLDKDAQQLEKSLRTIQGYLNDAEKKYITQDAVRAWLEDLEQVAFDADNILDELCYHALHKKVKAIKTMTNKALSFFSSFHHTARPRRIAHIIKEINTSFDSINKRATDLQLQSMLVNAPAAVPVAEFETDSFSDDPIFIGRDDDVPKLVKMMTEISDKKISILAIVGMGGMGKTTLTRRVILHQKMKTQFGCQSWVYVSQTFDPLSIFKKFLALLPPPTHEPIGTGNREAVSLQLQKSFMAKTDEPIGTRESILKRLHEALKDKTYLLVLDDVWTQDLQKWTDFIDSLSGVTSTKGNGIIITTRSTEVASVVNSFETYHLNGLSSDNCWSIIKQKAFDTRDVIPSEFETIGRKIARRCQGLPLAAKVVGGLLRGKSEQEWLSIKHKWIEGDSVSKILRLSYDNLPSSSLKKCFSYCSIFRKGHKMVKQELIELWMAEGFLQPDGGNDMESLGHKFLNVLVCNSLLQVVPRNDGDEDEEFFMMHDLVHDLANSVLGSAKVRYMRHDKSSHIPKDSAKYLRTLFLQGNISEFKLSDLKCLHVLSLGKKQKLLSSSIGKLVHLRRLDISKTKIRFLPDSIGELHLLQTLRANAYCLTKLPSTLKYLISLRHLYINDQVELPPEIGRLTSLQTLTHFRVGSECQIEELGRLTNLKGKLTISNLKKVQGKEEAKKANIFQNPNLFDLVFQWGGFREQGEIHKNVLEGLQPHPNLMKLKIVGYEGNRFPLWTLKMAVLDEPRGSWVCLDMLVEITLMDCRECEEIPTLGHLPNLKRLYLRDLKNVKNIKSSFYGIGIDNNGVCKETTIVFPMLERLELYSMPKLREWAEVEFLETRPHEVKVFPCLECLKIGDCKQLMSIPNHFSACLIELGLRGLNELERLPDFPFHLNQKLWKLSVKDCEKLRELPYNLLTISSLVKLTIDNCPNLKSIGKPRDRRGQAQGTLRKLRIVDCDGLIDLPHEIFDSWVPSLELVFLKNLNSLKNLPEVIESLSRTECLQYLTIEGVPKFMVAGSVKNWTFGSLRELNIDISVEWSRENEIAIKETVDGMLQGCRHSLQRLYLKGLEASESLPESIQNLISISSLELDDFGIKELPEWMGSLSSLKSLSLKDCNQLRHLGGNLTNLDCLSIMHCQGLHIDSAWLSNNLSIDIYLNHFARRPRNYEGGFLLFR